MSSIKKSIGMDFTEGSISTLLMKFLGPFLLASLLNSIYNTVDMIIIGQFVGSVGTVAVSMGGKILNLLTLVSTGLSSGGQILIGQQVGAKKKEELNATIGTLFGLLGVLSIVISIICLVFSNQILTLMNTPEESFTAARSYYIITTAGLPLIFGYNAVSSVLRGMGDSKRPLLFIAIAAALNLVLDIVFIKAFHLGAAGTAYATIIGQGVSLIFSVVFLYRRRDQFGFDFKLRSFTIVSGKANKILRLGGPLAAQGAMINLTQLYVISNVNALGLIASATYGIADKIVHLSNIVCQSVKQAGGAIAAQNIGADRHDRAKQVVVWGLIITLSISTVLSVFAISFPRAIFGLFTTDEAVMAYSFKFMLITALTLFLSSISSSYGTIITGTGHSMLGFLGGFLDGVVFRVSFGLFFGIYLNMGVIGFFLGHSLARLGVILVDVIYFHSGAWKKRKKLV
ncbi:MAG: efflux family protein [Pelosinus sp.]|jgi:putative MATE family efflux protein|nr:efflux family protein [Pelosinus sp.]